jgi:hypothetical protein
MKRPVKSGPRAHGRVLPINPPGRGAGIVSVLPWFLSGNRREDKPSRPVVGLETFGDYLLKDIGIMRHEIEPEPRRARPWP